MSVVTALIIFSGVAALICARARAAGPALLFGVVALVLLMATPAGAVLTDLVQFTVEFGEQAASQTGAGS